MIWTQIAVSGICNSRWKFWERFNLQVDENRAIVNFLWHFVMKSDIFLLDCLLYRFQIGGNVLICTAADLSKLRVDYNIMQILEKEKNIPHIS